MPVDQLQAARLVAGEPAEQHVVRDGGLVPEYVNGDNYRVFSSLRIPLGDGLCGWVALYKKPIVNGNPAVEPGYQNEAV